MPYNFDPDAPDPSMEPGIHLWRVTSCKEGPSKSKGLNQFAINLVRVDNPEAEMSVYIPLEGKARRYGVPKLLALLPGVKGEIGPSDFAGRRVWIATVVKEVIDRRTGDREFRLEIDERLLRYKGLQPDGEVPDGYAEPQSSGWDVGADPWVKPAATPTQQEDDDVPF